MIKAPVFDIGKIMNAHTGHTGTGLPDDLAQRLHAVQQPSACAARYADAVRSDLKPVFLLSQTGIHRQHHRRLSRGPSRHRRSVSHTSCKLLLQQSGILIRLCRTGYVQHDLPVKPDRILPLLQMHLLWFRYYIHTLFSPFCRLPGLQAI